MAKWVDRDCCEATCVLSNLGRAMADSPLPRRNDKIVAGNVVLDGIDFFAPVRNGTAVSMALIYYAGGLRLCMHYDSRHVTEAQADDLMATYLARFASRPTWRIEEGHGYWLDMAGVYWNAGILPFIVSNTVRTGANNA